MAQRFASPYPPEECQRRINGATGPFVMGAELLPGVVARITPTGFQLRHRARLRNSYAPILDATIAAAGAGSTISTRFRLNRFVLVFTSLWFAAVAGIGGAIVVASVRALARGEPRLGEANVWLGILFPAALMGLGLATVATGYSLGRRDRSAMITFVRRQLTAININNV